MGTSKEINDLLAGMTVRNLTKEQKFAVLQHLNATKWGYRYDTRELERMAE